MRWAPKMGCWPLRTIIFQRTENLNSLSNGITSLGNLIAFSCYSPGAVELPWWVGHMQLQFPGKGQDVLAEWDYTPPGSQITWSNSAIFNSMPSLIGEDPLLLFQATSLSGDLSAPVPSNITSKLTTPQTKAPLWIFLSNRKLGLPRAGPSFHGHLGSPGPHSHQLLRAAQQTAIFSPVSLPRHKVQSNHPCLPSHPALVGRRGAVPAACTALLLKVVCL